MAAQANGVPPTKEVEFKEFYTEVKEIEKRDSVLTPKQQIDRLLRPGSTYFNLNPFEVLQVEPETSLDDAKKKYKRSCNRSGFLLVATQHGNTLKKEGSYEYGCDDGGHICGHLTYYTFSVISFRLSHVWPSDLLDILCYFNPSFTCVALTY
ncbi:DnaJ (Hsp40), sub C, member 8 [Homalodisca vitripennis]|nr:DnaJ (Hsp40), sub C, member 8 [Homalodisca vitripennis]